MRRRTRSRGSSTLRPVILIVDRLESRELLSTTPTAPITAGIVAYPNFELQPLTNPTPPAGAFTPAQIQSAYGFSGISFNGVKGDGTGQTIAIVDAYDDPNIQNDLNAFSAQFGLPTTTVTRVNETGGTALPATDSSGGWELEESLDVEWAHAVAPNAKILLVEANSAYDTDLLAAVDYAASHAGVVSLSWGGGEFSGETSSSYESHFIHSGVSFVASSGDSGAPIEWPASSPNVISVGGTALTLGAGSTWGSETGWSGSGGGPSAFEVQPAYQKGVVTQTTAARANPDVAYDASPSTGFAVYDTDPYNGSVLGWTEVGGTSAGAPQWAALLAIANQGRALNGLPALDATSPQEVLTTLYKNAGSGLFHDVTTGSSAGSPTYSSGVGYDYVTGLGSPKAAAVVSTLVGVPSAPVDHLILGVPSTSVAGGSFTVTVTAKTSAGATDAGYLGTVHFTSSDAKAGLPANYTFTAADAGTHTFTVTLKTAAGETVTATDTANSAINGASSAIAVSPAAASQFVLTGVTANATVGSSVTFTVTAKDPYGNVATGYLGTVHFTSTDASAGLPANYTFTATDKGVRAFSVVFATAGSQTVTMTDTVAGFSATTPAINVAPAAPINLGATAASTSQINLSWSASSGATGYLIERSATGTSGWAQIGSTAAGVTTYSDGGLASGTTYYYRVRATGGSVNSAYSNVASATTTGTVTSSPTTLWSNSYTPSINAYSYGWYELGVKVRTDVAGTVTALRFYKQTWMGGYTHVGHLWSSTGQLLATATFTNETASGWEQVNLSSPVSINANTVYIVSFSSGGGYFGINTTYFASAGVNSGTLHALANGVSGGDGVYGSSGQFPTANGNGMNFWADLSFTPTSAPALRPAFASPAGGSVGTFAIAAPASSDSASSTPSGMRTASRQDVPVTVGAWAFRRTVPQAGSFSSGWSKGGYTYGASEF